MGLAGLWGGSWPLAPVLHPARGKRCSWLAYQGQVFPRTSLGRDGLTAALGAVGEKRAVLSPAHNSRTPQQGQEEDIFAIPSPLDVWDVSCTQQPSGGGTPAGGRTGEAVWARGDPLLCRDGKGRASLASPSWHSHKHAHTVLSRPWGRCGVSAAPIYYPMGCMSAPRAPYQTHGLRVNPMGSVSAPWAVYQPHKLYVSPTDCMSVPQAPCQPHGLCVKPMGFVLTPRAVYQPHKLYASPTGCISAIWAQCQPHRLYVSPTGSVSAPWAVCQPHGLCVSPTWLPVTLPRRAFRPPP